VRGLVRSDPIYGLLEGTASCAGCPCIGTRLLQTLINLLNQLARPNVEHLHTR